MSYSINSIANDCYPNSSVLINKFNIRDENKLNEMENAATIIRSIEWLAKTKDISFNFNHYKNIHKYLFGDIYDWAGKVRNIDISKQGTNFCKYNEIEKTAKIVFDNLKNDNFYKNLSHKEFIEKIVDFYISTNYLHPFREGNGRTQRVFLTQLINNAGYEIDFSKIDKDELMIATIQSANGVTDLLKEVFCKNINKT